MNLSIKLLAALAWHGALFTTLSLAAEPAEKSDPQAEAMMHKAHLARSGWSGSFPGFRADMRVAIDSERAEGRVTISGGEVKLELPAGAAAQWAAEQLESITMHRSAAVQDRFDVSFADTQTEHPLGRLIRFHGGTTHSLYRVKDDVITEVHRTLDKTRFTISVTDVTRNAEGQTLPRHFNVSYWDTESGALVSNNDFTDHWVRLGQFDLPQSRLLIRTSSGMRKVHQLVLTNHKLLP